MSEKQRNSPNQLSRSSVIRRGIAGVAFTGLALLGASKGIDKVIQSPSPEKKFIQQIEQNGAVTHVPGIVVIESGVTVRTGPEISRTSLANGRGNAGPAIPEGYSKVINSPLVLKAINGDEYYAFREGKDAREYSWINATKIYNENSSEKRLIATYKYNGDGLGQTTELLQSAGLTLDSLVENEIGSSDVMPSSKVKAFVASILNDSVTVTS